MTLDEASDALAARPADREVQRAAVVAILADIEAHPEARGQREALHRTLLSAEAAPDEPPVYAQELCRLLTSSQAAAADRLARDAEATLSSMRAGGGLGAPAVLFLLVGRATLSKTIGDAAIARLHEDWFPRLSWQQTTLPYNVAFGGGAFRRNADELLALFRPGGGVRLDAGLRPEHLVLLDWLGAQPLFADAAAFERYRAAAAPEASGEGEAALNLLAVRYAQANQKAFETARPRTSPRPVLALRAARSLAVAKAPALRPARRPRVAVCVSGQLRGYKAAFATWRARLLPLIDPIVVVHSWERVGRAGADPTRVQLPFAGAAFTDAYRTVATRLGSQATKARYPELFRRLDQGGRVAADDLKAFYGASRVVVEDDTAPRFAAMPNSDKMHYKIQAADVLARDLDCDLRLRIRPDKAIRYCAADLAGIARESAGQGRLYADHALTSQYGHLIVGDQVALGRPEAMAVYADTYETYPRLAAQNLLSVPPSLRGHVALATTAWCHGLQVDKLPFAFGDLMETERLSPTETLAAIEVDDRGEREDRVLLDAARADLRA